MSEYVPATTQSTIRTSQHPVDPNFPLKETEVPVTVQSQHERLVECMTPLQKLQYPVQLQYKHNKAVEVLRELKRRLVARGVSSFVAQQESTPCPLLDIIPSV